MFTILLRDRILNFQKCGQRRRELLPQRRGHHGKVRRFSNGGKSSRPRLIRCHPQFSLHPPASRSLSSVANIARSQRRGLATETSAEVDPDSIPEFVPDSPARTLPYKLYTSLILARSPFLTPTPTPLESTYYAYQSRIQRAITTPFPSEFYFKKGSLLERRFLAEERLREAEAFGEGFEPEEGAEKLEDVPSEEDDIRVLARETEADQKGDLQDLNRKGDRTLYLLVKASRPGKGSEHAWRFPYWETGLMQPLHKVGLLLLRTQASHLVLTI